MTVTVETPWGETTTLEDPLLGAKLFAWNHVTAGHKYTMTGWDTPDLRLRCDCGKVWP